MEVFAAPCELQSRLRRCISLLQPLVIDRTSVACALLCSLVFGYWTVDLTHFLSPAAAAFFILTPLSIYYLGRGAMRWIDPPASSGHPFPLTFLAGALVSCLLLFVIDFLSPLPMQWNCIAVLIIAVLLQFLPLRELPIAGNREGTLLTVLAVVVSLAAATFWTRDLRPYASQVGKEVVFRFWSDYFVHAQLAGQLRADQNLLRLGNPDLAGLPLPFYHYASYVFPASLSACTGQTACDSLASFWTPFGILLTGLAAYVVGSAWWSSRAGLAALVGTLLIPDASTYGVKDAYYSYHWLVVIVPGMLYGIAAAALALVLVTRGVRPTRWRRLGASFGLVLMCISLKAHLFVVVCPLLFTWVVLFKDGWTPRQRLSLSLGLVAVGCAGLLVADRFDIGPTIVPFGRTRTLATYYQELTEQLSDPFSAVMRALLSSLGMPILVFPVLVLFCYYRKTLQPVDAVPALAILIFLIGTFFLPPNDRRGTVDELRHRPFVWAYFVVAVWTWGKLVSIIDFPRPRWQAFLTGVIVVACTTMLAWPWMRGSTIQDPQLPWSDKFINLRIASGFVECAGFLREHASEAEIVQEDVTSDIPILGALAERRCYLAREPAYWQRNDPSASLPEESRRRAEMLRRIRRAATYDELQELAKQTGICWYVAHPGEQLDWPNEILTRPAFLKDGYAVYDLNLK